MSDTDTTEVDWDAVEEFRLGMLPPKFAEDGSLHKDWNEGQELPVATFADDHQSRLPTEEHACGKCSRVSAIGVPDDPFHLVWECPFCGTKNRTPGSDPRDLAVAVAAAASAQAAVEALQRGEQPAVTVVAHDVLDGGDAAV